MDSATFRVALNSDVVRTHLIMTLGATCISAFPERLSSSLKLKHVEKNTFKNVFSSNTELKVT